MRQVPPFSAQDGAWGREQPDGPEGFTRQLRPSHSEWHGSTTPARENTSPQPTIGDKPIPPKSVEVVSYPGRGFPEGKRGPPHSRQLRGSPLTGGDNSPLDIDRGLGLLFVKGGFLVQDST